MDGLMGLMSAMEGGRGGLHFKSISESDLDKGFQPIEGLKTGDRVTLKGPKYATYKGISVGDVVIVHRVAAFGVSKYGRPIEDNDFSAIMDDGDESDAIRELPLDSRRFERVE